MGLCVKITKNDLFGVFACCDACGKIVKDRECNMLSLREFGANETVSMFIACKGQCTDKLDPHDDYANQELGQCLLYFAVNSAVDVEKAMQEQRRFYDEFGIHR